MVRPLVSVVLPTYNGSRYLGESIESIIRQSLVEWELIIVDDHSTDGTAEIVQKFMSQDSRIRFIRHEQNRKLPAALNTGFNSIKGAYATWTSDDNLYRESALQEMVDILENKPAVDMVYTDFTEIDEDGNILSVQNALPLLQLLDKNIVGPSFMFRQEVFKSVGTYSENLFLAEDYDYWLRVSASHVLEPLHRDLYLYRTHGVSLSGTNRIEKIWEMRDKALYENLNTMKWVDLETQVHYYLKLSRRAFQRKDFNFFLRGICSSFSVSTGLTLKRLSKSFL